MSPREARQRPEQRFRVAFGVQLTWQTPRGEVHRTTGMCTDLSASGMRIETLDAFGARTAVVVSSKQFGRIGHASIRYCRRNGMKYEVGLQFHTAFSLGDPARRAILETVLQGTAYTI